MAQRRRSETAAEGGEPVVPPDDGTPAAEDAAAGHVADAADAPTQTADAVAEELGEPVSLEDLGLTGPEIAPAADETPGTGGVPDDLKAIVEALVFASPEPLSIKALAKVLDGEARDNVARVLASLRHDYDRRGGLQLIEVAGGYQIVTRPDLNDWVRRLFHERKSTKLSVAALETLAVIAYRQPVTAAEIAEIRGVNTSGVLATLVERKLIKIAGRKNVVGRPFLYATTREFLLRFGLNDVSDLPRVEEMADALGFDLPAALSEPMPSEQFLPLGDPEEAAVDDPPGPVDEVAPAGPSDPPDQEDEAGGQAPGASGRRRA